MIFSTTISIQFLHSTSLTIRIMRSSSKTSSCKLSNSQSSRNKGLRRYWARKRTLYDPLTQKSNRIRTVAVATRIPDIKRDENSVWAEGWNFVPFDHFSLSLSLSFSLKPRQKHRNSNKFRECTFTPQCDACCVDAALKFRAIEPPFFRCKLRRGVARL